MLCRLLKKKKKLIGGGRLLGISPFMQPQVGSGRLQSPYTIFKMKAKHKQTNINKRTKNPNHTNKH
jgi:hypothetical protein